jgi:cyclopropane-fatty-acyl-phospholipid synthase
VQSVLNHALSHFGGDSLAELFVDCPCREFQVQLWDGSTWDGSADPRFVLAIKHPRALEHMFVLPSELSLGESYVFGDLEIRGDIESAMEVGDYLLTHRAAIPLGLRLAQLLHKPVSGETTMGRDRKADLVGSVHSKARDRCAIHYHYDLPPEFFALWLDKRMVYSCAYFGTEMETLDVAQNRKLDYICRKLRLHPGEKLLDIGCGWGGFLTFAAQHYGARVLGITLSASQAETARKRVRDAGLNEQCRVELCDYRELGIEHRFDKIVSVGMFEHVGESKLPEYFSRVWQVLRPGGVFLNPGISASTTYARGGPSFIDNYVFPDGELVPIGRTLELAESSGFEVRDVESLREHYALTLRRWVRNLEAQAPHAKPITDETTYRIWRLYMAGSAYAFRKARLNLYQVLLAKPEHGESQMPLTRADWYCH